MREGGKWNVVLKLHFGDKYSSLYTVFLLHMNIYLTALVTSQIKIFSYDVFIDSTHH